MLETRFRYALAASLTIESVTVSFQHAENQVILEEIALQSTTTRFGHRWPRNDCHELENLRQKRKPRALRPGKSKGWGYRRSRIRRYGLQDTENNLGWLEESIEYRRNPSGKR
jgi:hypothetical protein